ncbi:hypothetical protein B9479_003144 [Cryptococcus floricola]|uniref:Uncharacterized protein n=1 Tax=Cryptococcus floricola TaxID=2591691 RepID=A0A5D3AZD4_9TREE|nr:hypothetical protein B9479_003144 [Cryptococcus floricola]
MVRRSHRHRPPSGDPPPPPPPSQSPPPSPSSTDREEEQPHTASHQTGDATDNPQNTPSVQASAPTEGSTNTAAFRAPNNRAGDSSRIATPACPEQPQPARQLVHPRNLHTTQGTVLYSNPQTGASPAPNNLRPQCPAPVDNRLPPPLLLSLHGSHSTDATTPATMPTPAPMSDSTVVGGLNGRGVGRAFCGSAGFDRWSVLLVVGGIARLVRGGVRLFFFSVGG